MDYLAKKDCGEAIYTKKLAPTKKYEKRDHVLNRADCVQTLARKM